MSICLLLRHDFLQISLQAVPPAAGNDFLADNHLTDDASPVQEEPRRSAKEFRIVTPPVVIDDSYRE